MNEVLICLVVLVFIQLQPTTYSPIESITLDIESSSLSIQVLDPCVNVLTSSTKLLIGSTHVHSLLQFISTIDLLSKHLLTLQKL
jgi:hypothetical protein